MFMLKNILKKSKSQGLSLSTVVVAALVLLVLVILTIVFASRMGGWNQSMSNCDTVCVDNSASCSDEGYMIPVPVDNCNDGNTKIDGPGFCCRSESN